MVAWTHHAHEVEQYFDDVETDKLVASRYVKAMVKRHRYDLAHADELGLEFSERQANRAINFCPMVSHTKGQYAGQPFILRTWQKAICWLLFGWRRAADGLRRFRYSYISIGRGNGKTPLSSVISLYLFLADDPLEPRAEVYALATKREQARSGVWDEARKQILSNPEFADLVDVRQSNLNILEPPWNGSKFEPQGSNYRTADSWVLHCAVIDELHAWRDSLQELLDKAESAMSKRRQPLFLITTTAGDDKSTVWRREYEFYTGILEDRYRADDRFAFIAEVDKLDPDGQEIDPLDEHYWPQANPMLNEPDSPVKIDALRSAAQKAKVDSAAENMFRRYYCNQQVVSYFRYMPPEVWDCGNQPRDIRDNQPCHSGFDWGWRDDLASLALFFPPEQEGEPGQLKCWSWIPSDGPRDLTVEPWRSWIEAGQLIATDGDTTDIESIYKKFDELVRQYQILTLAADPNNCREFLTRVNNQWGVETFTFFQGVSKYNEPTKKFKADINAGRLIHGGDPVLTWCANNLTVKTDPYGYIMPAKGKSTDKIDPIVASIMAFSEAGYAATKKAVVDYQAGELING